MPFSLQSLRDQIKQHTIGTLNGSVLISDAQADVFIQIALGRMLNDHDWQFQQETAVTFTYDDTTNGVSLPADFIREVNVNSIDTAVPALNNALTPMVKVERWQWVNRLNQPTISDTFPVPGVSGLYYYLWDSKIWVVPQPSDTISVQLDYIQDVMVPSDTNPLLSTSAYGTAAFSGALREAYLWLHEDERAAVHDGNFKDLMGAAKKRDTSIRVGGPKRER